jgi:Tfp pilus assembly protein PilW
MIQRAAAGFSLIEALAATALTLIVGAVAVMLLEFARASFAVQPEAADLQQRLRVAAVSLYGDLVIAGAGVSQGANLGPLVSYFAPVVPYRQGTDRDDPPGSFKTDTITVMYVPPTTAQTTLAGPGPAAAGADISINQGPGCPALDPLCGFKVGTTAVVYDASGAYDTFTVTGFQPSGLHLQRTSGVLTSTTYAAETTTIAQVANVVYSLKTDPVTGSSQLVSREGATGSDVPVIDHLVALQFDYYGEPQPPRVLVPDAASILRSPKTTYGPGPPPLVESLPAGGYPPGENCLFAVDAATMEQIPRLPVLSADAATPGLAHLTAAELTDGPWCPDASNVNRWDADLLRIRTIAITLRIEAADRALRGPAGILFTNGGTAGTSTRWLPDQTVRFQVTPRNLQTFRP